MLRLFCDFWNMAAAAGGGFLMAYKDRCRAAVKRNAEMTGRRTTFARTLAEMEGG